MSMAVSLEVREPFFDHDLVEYMLQVPDQFKKSRYSRNHSWLNLLKPCCRMKLFTGKNRAFFFPGRYG